MGLQIALAFDLGVLTDYGPSTQIDPIRDRFIGIVLGILIISTVFSLVWPEDATSIARQKLAARERYRYSMWAAVLDTLNNCSLRSESYRLWFSAPDRDPRQRMAGCLQTAWRTAALLPRTFSFH